MPDRGYNTIYLPWSGFGFPNNLQPTPGATELTFEQFCSLLEAASVTRLRVKLVGWQGPLGTSAKSFEPKLGVFNDWDGRLGQLVEACGRHGVRLQVIAFDNQEWRKGWALHAWNKRNGGMLDDPRLVFTDNAAIDAAKNRIDHIAQYCGDAIDSFEICAEMAFLATPDFWKTSGWTNDMRENIRLKMVPWVTDMAEHIKTRSDAPVGNGQIFVGNQTFPDDPNHPANVRNEMFRVPELDFALCNWYDGDLARKVRWLRQCQAYADKPIYVEQYAPWALGRNAPYTREPDDLRWSKAHEWAGACGEFGFIGPMRWPEIKGAYADWWGIAHPNMAKIAGVTAGMASLVNLRDWDRGEAWDSNITSSGAVLKSSWGDGQHVTAFVQWNSTGTKEITVSDMANRQYRAHSFDYITGASLGSQIVEGGHLTFDIQTRGQYAAFIILPEDDGPPPEPEPEVRTIEVRGVLKVDGMEDGTFEGILTETLAAARG